MGVTLRDLGNGQLPNTKGTLYTAPALTSAAAKVSVTNTTGADKTFNIYVNKSGTSRLVSSKDQTLASGARWVGALHTLEAGDLIEGDASAATSLDYVIDGFEVT